MENYVNTSINIDLEEQSVDHLIFSDILCDFLSNMIVNIFCFYANMFLFKLLILADSPSPPPSAKMDI